MSGGRCYNYRGHHIPGCWGCAVGGHLQCTCDPGTAPTRSQLERRIEQLEAQVRELVASSDNGGAR